MTILTSTLLLIRRMGMVGLIGFSVVLSTAHGTDNTNIDERVSEYILATGFTGGTYYHAGLAIATQIDVRMNPEAGFGLIARPTAGSVENVELLKGGEAHLAILQAHIVDNYLEAGHGFFLAGSVPVASIGCLWRNVEHFLLDRKYVSTGSLSDVKAAVGKPVYLGAESSGTLSSTTRLLRSLNIQFPQDDLVSASYDAVVGKLNSNEIVFASLPGGDPVSAVARAFASLGTSMRMLEVTDDELAIIQKITPHWERAVIPPDTYPLQTEALASIAQRNVLVVRADVPDEDVYRMAKEIYNNVERLTNTHAALGELAECMDNVASISPPLHPGAARYFAERHETALGQTQQRP